MARSILATGSTASCSGEDASWKSRWEAALVTSSFVLRLIRHDTRTRKGSLLRREMCVTDGSRHFFISLLSVSTAISIGKFVSDRVFLVLFARVFAIFLRCVWMFADREDIYGRLLSTSFNNKHVSFVNIKHVEFDPQSKALRWRAICNRSRWLVRNAGGQVL